MGLSAGTMVTDRIRLERLLGEGGMGSVWVAEHLTLGAKVAVKFVSPELSTKHPELHARFLREAAAAAKINSPHVVRTFDFGAMPDGTPFLVMELLEGESLADRLQREKALPPQETALVIGQVAKALSEAHRLGVVHRDIKPGNIFLTRSGRDLFAKVLDFGIAKDTAENTQSSSTKTGFALGTPQYMSPEQLMSAKGVDLQADLWALAVTAYETVTGTPPFRGETVPHLIVSIHAQKFEAPSSLHLPPVVPDMAALDRFFARAFATDKDKRFRSALELADALAIACSDPSSAPASTAAARTVYGAPVGEPIATAATEPQAPPKTTMGAPLDAGTTSAGPSTPIAEPLPIGTGTEPGAPTAVSSGAEAPRGTRVGSNTVVPDRASSPEGPRPVALSPVRPAPAEKSRTAIYIGAAGAVAAVGVVAALALGGPSKKNDAPDAETAKTAEARPSAKRIASVETSGPATESASPSASGPAPSEGRGHVDERSAGNTFVPAFDWKRASERSKTVVGAMRVCRDAGSSLCTEDQFAAACAADASVGNDMVLVGAKGPGFSTLRGGGGCDGKQSAGKEASVLCCTDGVGVDADDETLRRTWAKRLTAYQVAQNNHDTAKLGAEFYADDVSWGGSQFTREGIQKEADRFFKGSPSVYQLYAHCHVTKEGPNKRAKCDTALDYRSNLGAHSVVQTLVFNGDDKLISVNEENTTKLQ